MANSTMQTKPSKPYDGFPLFPHDSGRWAKKVKGRTVYFGRWGHKRNGTMERVADDGWREALQLFQVQRDDLYAGRTPRQLGDGLTVADLCNRFLSAKRHLLDTDELSPRTFRDYYRTCETLVQVFGKPRLVDDLTTADFQALRATLAKRMGPVALGSEINQSRMVFKFGFDDGLLETPIRYGQSFNRPSRKTLRKVRAENGRRMFEAAEVKAMLDNAKQPLKAMFLLGVNLGYGPTDCAQLALNTLRDAMSSGWIEYARIKTGISRRAHMWPETFEACREALEMRRIPTSEEARDKAFVTKYGGLWVKPSGDDAIAKETAKLLTKLGFKKPGLGFYGLRRVVETIGGECKDQIAVNAIMGHVDESMAAQYREGISDERLRAVTDTVRVWLFGAPEEK